MLPTINKRFLFKMLLILGVLVGSLAGIHALQARRIPDALKRQADRATQAGKKDAAISYLRQYLEFRPTDVDAQEQLAELIKSRANSNGYAADLLLLYEKILRTDPNRHAIRRDALKLSLSTGRYTDAETHVEILLKSYPEDAELWRSLAASQLALQKGDAVVKSLEKAIELEPKNPASYQQLASFYFKEKHQPAEAAKVMDHLIAAMPDDANSYISRAFFVIANDERRILPIDSAIADLKEALRLKPDNADALLMLAEQLQRGRDLPAAADLLARGIAVYPQEPKFVRSLSWLELKRGNIGSAVAVLEGALNRIPPENSFEMLVSLADLLVQLGETERTRDLLGKLDSRSKPEARAQAKYIRGRLAMREDHWDDAIAIMQDLRSDPLSLPGLENQANLLLSICYRKKGDSAKELECLQLLTNRDTAHLEAREALGRAYLNAGRFDEALREFELATRSVYATANTRATLLKMRIAQLKTAAVTPSSIQWDALEAEAKDVAALFGSSNGDGAILRAEVATARGATDRAVAVLRAEAYRRPSDMRLWSKLALALADLAGVPVGLAVLDEAQAIAGDGPDVRLARAALYTRDPAKLRSIEKLSGQIDTWPDAEQQRLLDGLLDVYERMGDDAGKLKTFRRIAGRRFSDAAVWDAVYELAVESNDAAMKADAEAALAKLPNGGDSKALRSAWDALATKQRSYVAAAREELVKRYGSTPDRPDACIALGRLLMLEGDSKAAAELHDRAVRLEPTVLVSVVARIELLARQPEGILPQAMKALAQDYRWAGESYRRVVRQSMKRLDDVSARRVLDAAKPWIEGNPGDSGWLGDRYAELKISQEAGQLYDKAVQYPRATTDDWLRLALFQTSKDQVAEVLDQAKSKLSSTQHIVLLASFAESSAAPTGWTPELKTDTEKRQFAQAALALKLSRYQRREAISMLEGFLEDSSRPKSDLAWARRNLAMLYASQGNPLDRKKAKDLLATKDSSPGETPDEKRATAAVLAGLSRQLESDDRKQVVSRAIEILTDVAATTNDKRDRFLLAQINRTSGERDGRVRGRTLLLELLREDPKNIDYLIAGLEEATEPQDREFADTCASDLLKNYPAEFRAVSAVARYEARIGRPERSLELANGYARTVDGTPGDLQLRYARAAQLLDELARGAAVRRTPLGKEMTDSAVSKFESLFPSRPEAVVAAAGLLAADGRAKEAFEKIERHSKTLPMRVKVMAGLAVLRSSPATSKQIALVQEWLTLSKNGEPNSIPVLLNEADFCLLQGNTGGAEKAYEAVLALDDRNALALNNLAWLLAANPQRAERAAELVDKAVQEMGLTGELLDTRARIKIAARQYEAAERDLLQALTQEKTPLRYFHLALTMQSQTPARNGEASENFQKAKAKGLKEQAVHPADIALFRSLSKDEEPK